jgi:hypothetical protein
VTQLRELNSVAGMDIFQAAKETVSMCSDANVPWLSGQRCSIDSTCTPVEREAIGPFEDWNFHAQSWNQ